MRSWLRILGQLYRLLLNLYPVLYTDEYGEEMQAVFNLSLEAASTTSRFEIARLILLEMISMPKAAFLEHLR